VEREDGKEDRQSPSAGDGADRPAETRASDVEADAPSASDPPASNAPNSQAEAETAQAEVAKIRDQLLRTAADFDNFRKRSRREVADAERRGREELLKELLPIFDNLERAVSHAETASDVKSLADGIGMVMRQFTDTLGRLGIERVASVGNAFDPAQHEAIQQLETAAHPPGTVAAEVQAGYKLGDRLIRPALVVVAKAPANGGSS
jgi:molecular chaperone GrpE